MPPNYINCFINGVFYDVNVIKLLINVNTVVIVYLFKYLVKIIMQCNNSDWYIIFSISGYFYAYCKYSKNIFIIVPNINCEHVYPPP